MRTVNAKTSDVSLEQAPFVSKGQAGKLQALEIHTVRQLAARLEGEASSIGDYLELDQAGLQRLCTDTEEFLQEHLPAATIRSIFPRVHSRGVAIHRLGDRSRPRFKGD